MFNISNNIQNQAGNLILSSPAFTIYKKVWVNAKPILEYPMVVYYNKDKPHIARE